MIVSVVSHATNDATCQYLITIFHGFVFFSVLKKSDRSGYCDEQKKRNAFVPIFALKTNTLLLLLFFFFPEHRRRSAALRSVAWKASPANGFGEKPPNRVPIRLCGRMAEFTAPARSGSRLFTGLAALLRARYLVLLGSQYAYNATLFAFNDQTLKQTQRRFLD